MAGPRGTNSVLANCTEDLQKLRLHPEGRSTLSGNAWARIGMRGCFGDDRADYSPLGFTILVGRNRATTGALIRIRRAPSAAFGLLLAMPMAPPRKVTLGDEYTSGVAQSL